MKLIPLNPNTGQEEYHWQHIERTYQQSAISNYYREKRKFPDFYGGNFSDDDYNLIIYIVGDTLKGKKETAKILNNTSLSIKSCNFSYNHLTKVDSILTNFFQNKKNSSIISTLLSLMGKQDIAIMDMFTHASVFDGCLCTNTKRFLHNNVDSLIHVLKNSGDFKNKFVIIDGVYSQDGDIAPVDKIYSICKDFGAFLIVDDAHGIGVLGKTGRGIIEDYGLLDKVDMITGTFSKSFGCVGGYAIARKEIITLLRYYSRQNIFSAAATPQTAASAIKAIQLVDKEPQLRNKLLDNINYFKKGLEQLCLDFGNTESAIFPVMVRSEHNVKEAARVLFDQGIYVNPISYPAVPEKLSRLRFSITAMHTLKDLDETLNILESIKNTYNLTKK